MRLEPVAGAGRVRRRVKTRKGLPGPACPRVASMPTMLPNAQDTEEFSDKPSSKAPRFHGCWPSSLLEKRTGSARSRATKRKRGGGGRAPLALVLLFHAIEGAASHHDADALGVPSRHLSMNSRHFQTVH